MQQQQSGQSSSSEESLQQGIQSQVTQLNICFGEHHILKANPIYPPKIIDIIVMIIVGINDATK